MKTPYDCLLLAAFVFCVAFAALTKQPLPIIAAAIAAALLIGNADESAPRHRHLPGQRRTTSVDRDIRHVGRQIWFWQAYLILCACCLLVASAYLAFLIHDGRWPGGWVRLLPGVMPEQREGIVLGLAVGSLMVYCIVVSSGCVQPLKTVLCRLHTELDGCMNAESARDATVGHPDWRADNQLDWDCPHAQQRLAEERRRRLFGD